MLKIITDKNTNFSTEESLQYINWDKIYTLSSDRAKSYIIISDKHKHNAICHIWIMNFSDTNSANILLREIKKRYNIITCILIAGEEHHKKILIDNGFDISDVGSKYVILKYIKSRL